MAGDLDWEDNPDPKFRDTCDRILVLWQVELEPIERTVLKELQRRHFFTDLEKLGNFLLETHMSELGGIKFMERYYSIFFYNNLSLFLQKRAKSVKALN